MTEKATADTQGKHYEVDVKNIEELNRGGGNIRKDYGTNDGSFDDLVKSIEENGIKMPLRGFRNPEKEGGWIVIDGHRRLAAAMKLVTDKGITIRAKIITVDARKVSDEQLIVDMFVTNSGKPLSPIEEAEGIRRLTNFGLKPKEIARMVGKKELLVKNL